MSNLFFSFPITKAENMNIFRVQFLHILLSEEIRLVGIEFGYNLSSNSLSPFFFFFFLVCVKFPIEAIKYVSENDNFAYILSHHLKL